MRKNFIVFLVAAFMCFIITGCAMFENRFASQTEQELIAAGFITKLANSPEKLEKLKTMKQRALVLYERDGTNFYVYANDNKNCIYIGDDKAYQKYQTIQLKQEQAEQAEQIAADNRAAASYNQAAASQEAMDWGMWGPWGPYGW